MLLGQQHEVGATQGRHQQHRAGDDEAAERRVVAQQRQIANGFSQRMGTTVGGAGLFVDAGIHGGGKQPQSGRNPEDGRQDRRLAAVELPPQ